MKKKWILRDHRVQDLCVDYIDSIDTRPDDLIEVIVRPYKKNRSLEQNDMFHAWCGTIAEQTGHSKGEIKDILIESVFGTEEYLNLQGEKRSRLRATSDMNVGEILKSVKT